MTKIAEDLKQYSAILLSGCAVLGAAHVGFLLSLQQEQRCRFLKVVSGTSIGSLVAMFFAAGIPLTNVLDVFRKHTLLSLIEPLDSVGDMLQAIGVGTSDRIIALCENLLREHDIDPTIFTFAKMKSIGLHIDCVVVASLIEDVTSDVMFTPAYFSAHTHPQMLVLNAIRLSINIPFVFAAPSFEGLSYMDGILTDELPFAYIADKYNLDIEDMLAHAPFSCDHNNNNNNNNMTVSSLLRKLFQHSLHRIRAASHAERVVRTKLLVSLADEISATPSLIDYFVICGIKNTRRFINASEHVNKPHR